MDTISYKDFQSLQLVIAKVVAAEIVEGADRLLKLTLDAGEDLGERTVASGIRQWYQPEDLVGTSVVYLANLEPRTIRGIVSQGMIVAAGSDEAILLHPDRAAAPGTIVR